MNHKCLLLLIPLAFFLPVSSFSDNSNSHVTVRHENTQGKILGSLMVLNKNEIAVSILAKKKSNNSEVQNFAELMIRDHGKNLQKTKALSRKTGIEAEKGSKAIELEKKGRQVLKTLKNKQGTSFDKAYMDSMVKGHVNALNLVNNLIAKASNPIIRKHLENTKKHIKQHLKKAKAIQKEFNY